MFVAFRGLDVLVDLKLVLPTLLCICRLFSTDEKQRDAEVYSMAANTEETGGLRRRVLYRRLGSIVSVFWYLIPG